MIVGIGIDIVEISRLQESITRNPERFVKKCFTETEIDFCKPKKNAYEHFAARFAGKEACFKALGTGWDKGIGWLQVETNNDESGKPALRLRGTAAELADTMGISNFVVSISHTKSMAVAVVIAEGKNDTGA